MGTLGAGAEYYLRGLLGLRDETDVAPILSKDHQRRRMIEVCSTWIHAQARVQPTAIIVEDLHWADPSSIEVLDACVQNIATSRLLLLVTTRPEFGPPWVHAEHHTTLSLTRLDAVEIRELIQHRLSGMDRARDLIDALASRSDGIPLFAEELAIAYADTMHDSAAAIPATLHDSLMARLDRLSRAKPLAQFAAVLGREFSANELRSIVSSTPEEFDAALLELVAADLITIEQLATDMRCEFKHGLVQQAAYDSLLHRNRAEIHAVIAERMLTHHDLADHPQLVVVAHHLSESHQIELAIDAWEYAANRATATSANQEAVGFYDTALELLSQLPDTADRTQREITMLLNKLSFHFMIEGPTGSHALTALARMRALSKTLPHDDYQHIDVLANSIGFMLSKGDLDNASDLADEFFVAAVESGNDGLICQAHISLASIALNRGALNAAVDHARVALAHEGPYDHPIGLQTSRSFALLYGGSAACILGDFDFGLPCADELFAIATEVGGDPLKALLAKVGATVLAVNLRRFEQTILLAHELDDAGRLFGLDTLIGWGCIYGGWAAAHCAVAGSAEAIAGAAQARLGLGMHIETHQNIGIAQSFALVAEAHLRAGLFEEGIALIEDALSRADHQQSHQYSVELLMNRALLRAAISGFDDEAIEQDFVTALSIANELNARLFELRTRINYARWLHTKQRSSDAVNQLAPTLAAIGHYDLHDIHAARELLHKHDQS